MRARTSSWLPGKRCPSFEASLPISTGDQIGVSRSNHFKRSGISTVEPFVGAFVDRARGGVLGMALTEGTKDPAKPSPDLPQLKDEAERRSRCAFLAEWDIELPAPREPGTVRTHRLAWPPNELSFGALDFATGAFGLNARGRAPIQPFDLLRPLLVSENERHRCGLFPCAGHVSTIRPSDTPSPQTNFAGAKSDSAVASPRRQAARRRRSGA
jgi:hypothetical protein